jgi:hypothetical protein
MPTGTTILENYLPVPTEAKHIHTPHGSAGAPLGLYHQTSCTITNSALSNAKVPKIVPKLETTQMFINMGKDMSVNLPTDKLLTTYSFNGI